MNKYTYDGPVKEFDTIIANRWISSTLAVSEKKARANLAYQYKKRTNRSPASRITLPGKIEMVG